VSPCQRVRTDRRAGRGGRCHAALAVFVALLGTGLVGPYRPCEAESPIELVAYQYFRLAWSAFERGDVKDAARRFGKAVGLAPRWSQAQDMLGFTLELQGKRDAAKGVYRTALKSDPYDAFAWHALTALGDRPTTPERPTETAETWQRYRQGLLLVSQEKVEKALHTLYEAAALSPGWVEVRNTLAYLYERHRTKQDAVRELRSVLQIAPGDPYATHALAELAPNSTGATAQHNRTTGPTYPQYANDDSNAVFEAELFALINEERRKRGLNELVHDDLLTKIAREHAGEMRDKHFFAHESPTPGRRLPLDRYMLYARRKPEIIAENVARRWGTRKSLTKENIRQSHRDLMNSPPHRANILRPGVTHLGVGVASNERGDYWITEVFAKPR